MTDRLQSLFSLEGKTAVVTGGSRGIGEMIAEGFVDAGASVIMTARKAEALQATADRLTAKGGHVTAIPGDLSTPEGVTAFADAVKGRVDSLDILNQGGVVSLSAWCPHGVVPAVSVLGTKYTSCEKSDRLAPMITYVRCLPALTTNRNSLTCVSACPWD